MSFLPEKFSGEFKPVSLATDVDSIEKHKNLAFRTLYSGDFRRLPSGQDAARHLGIDDQKILNPDRHDPLWYYIVAEAAQEDNEGKPGGQHLGVLGSKIFAGTIANLLKNDLTSVAYEDEWWAPDEKVGGANFRAIDIPRFAGLPITGDDWDNYWKHGPKSVAPLDGPLVAQGPATTEDQTIV